MPPRRCANGNAALSLAPPTQTAVGNGMKVLAAFLGGGPDKPLVIRWVCNSRNQPNYPLLQRVMMTRVENHIAEPIVANTFMSIGGANLTAMHRSRTTSIGQTMTIDMGSGPGGDGVRRSLAGELVGITAAACVLQSHLPAMTRRAICMTAASRPIGHRRTKGITAFVHH